MKKNKTLLLLLSIFITFSAYSEKDRKVGTVNIKINEKQLHHLKIHKCYIPDLTKKSVVDMDKSSISNYSIRAFRNVDNDSFYDPSFFLDGRNNFSNKNSDYEAKFDIVIGDNETYSGFFKDDILFYNNKLTYIAKNVTYGVSGKVKSTNNKIEIKIDCR